MVPPKTCRSGHTGAPASQLMMDLAKKGFQLRSLRLRHLDSSFLGTNGYLNRPFLSSHVIPGSTYLAYLHTCLGLPGKSPDWIRFNILAHLRNLDEAMNVTVCCIDHGQELVGVGRWVAGQFNFKFS